MNSKWLAKYTCEGTGSVRINWIRTNHWLYCSCNFWKYEPWSAHKLRHTGTGARMLCNAGFVGVTKCIYFADNCSYFPTTHALHNIPAIELISSHWILCNMFTLLNMMYQQVIRVITAYIWSITIGIWNTIRINHYPFWWAVSWSILATFFRLRLILNSKIFWVIYVAT